MKPRGKDPVVLTDGEVCVSTLKEDLAEAVSKAWDWWNDKRAKAFLVTDDFPPHRKAFTDFLVLLIGRTMRSPGADTVWAIKYDGKAAGISLVVNGMFQIVTAREWWRNGLGTKAAKLIIDHYFSTTGAARLSAMFPSGNHVGKQFLSSLGFEREGKLRDAVMIDGPRNALMFGILRADLEKWGEAEKKQEESPPETSGEEKPTEEIVTEEIETIADNGVEAKEEIKASAEK